MLREALKRHLRRRNGANGGKAIHDKIRGAMDAVKFITLD
jgi:hypothetical protein